jgi:hypothetical protein
LTDRSTSDEIIGCGQWVRVRIDVPTDVDDDDVGALFGHRERVRTPLTPRATRDESDLALEPSRHVSSADVNLILRLQEPNLRSLVKQ